MRKSSRWPRLLALLGVLAVLVAAVAPMPAPAAAQSYEPEPWSPPASHNVTTVRWGPITIPAAEDGMEGEVHNEIAIDGTCSPFIGLFASCRSMEIEKPCEDCYITGILPDLVLAGTDIGFNHDTGGELHHVVNVNFSRPDPTCPPGAVRRGTPC